MTPSQPDFRRPRSRTTQQVDDLLVVGGGLVGCVCAVAAAQSGMSVTLLAGIPPRHLAIDEVWDRRVYALNGATRDFLSSLKIWQQLDPARVAPIVRMEVFGDQGGTLPLSFSSYEAGIDALAWIVEHRELARVFDSALGFQQGVTVFAAECEAVTRNEEFAEVTAREVRHRAALLVGADGANSLVRDSAGIAAPRRSFVQSGIVANFAVATPHLGVARQWFTSEGVVALLPLPDHAVSLVWSAPDKLADQLVAGEPVALARRIEALVGLQSNQLNPISGISRFPLSSLLVESQVADRVALVGDSAHVVHPLAGQGLNLGMDDVRVLVKILAARENFRDCGDAVLLRRYARARREAIFAMHGLTSGLNRLFANEDPLVRSLRTTGMRAVNAFPFVKNWLIRQAFG